MSSHDNPNLRDMHALLQEMKAMHDEGLYAEHDLDHMGLNLNPFKAYANYKENKQSKDDQWTQTTQKWAKFSLDQKKSVLVYVVEHDVNDAWTAMEKSIAPTTYKATTTPDARKSNMTTIIKRDDANTVATIEAIVQQFAKYKALKAVFITKVRDEPEPTPESA